MHLFLIDHLVNYKIFHPKIYIFLRIFNSEFSYIEVLSTNQNSTPLEIEDKINITLVIDALFSSTERSNICKRLLIFVFC